MANKTFEDLAKNLGYNSFFDMKTTIGKSDRSVLSDIFAKRKKKETSPSREGAGGDTINSDIIPFLNIIAKNSLALPGMARDMNVLRQNIVKLVKLKSAEAVTTKADKFFKTEDQREAELEEAKKKEKVTLVEGEDGKKKRGAGKEEKDMANSIFDFLWGIIKKVGGALLFGLFAAFATVFKIGDFLSELMDKFTPLKWIENLFKAIEDGWTKLTETDILKESLIKGLGNFLDFITNGLFGEKELRKSLDELSEYITPMITVISEVFTRMVDWMKNNIGWDTFTIPLSKANKLPIIGTALSKLGISLPDIEIPGFRPFQKKKQEGPKEVGGSIAPPPVPQQDLSKANVGAGGEEIQTDEQGNVISGGGFSPTPDKAVPSVGRGPTPIAPPKKQSDAKAATQNKDKALDFLKFKVGVVPSDKSPTGFADIKGNPISEIAVRDRIVDMRGDPDKILSLVKAAPTAVPSAAPASTIPAQNAATGSASGSQTAASAGSAAPSASPSASSSSSAPSGSSIGQMSSDVAEGQRLDSAADKGTTINAPTVNNSSGSTGKAPKTIADAYNKSFVGEYYSAA